MKDYQLFFDAVECEELFKFLHVDAPKDEVEYIIHNAPKEEVRTYCIFTCRARLLSRSVWITSLTICRVFLAQQHVTACSLLQVITKAKAAETKAGKPPKKKKKEKAEVFSFCVCWQLEVAPGFQLSIVGGKVQSQQRLDPL